MKRNPSISNFLEDNLGGDPEKLNQKMVCAQPPFGCGKPIEYGDFLDELSIKEWGISGLCQSCQDDVFN